MSGGLPMKAPRASARYCGPRCGTPVSSRGAARRGERCGRKGRTEACGTEGGYAGLLVRWALTVLALTVSIVKRTDDLTGFQVIPRRWVVERTPAWISEQRRSVRDYETRPQHAEAMVRLLMITTMSRRLARSASPRRV